jgi:hypothetical protein
MGAMVKNIIVFCIFLTVMLFSTKMFSQSKQTLLLHYKSLLSKEKRTLFELTENNKWEDLKNNCHANIVLNKYNPTYVMGLLAYYNKYKNFDSIKHYSKIYFDLAIKDTYQYGDYPLELATDYNFLPGLTEDTLYINFFKTLCIDFYAKQKYPKTNLGMQILLLGIDDQLTRNIPDTCETKNCKDLQTINLKYRDSITQQQLVSLLEENGGYLTSTEIGPEAFLQRLIFLHTEDIDFRIKRLMPIIQKAWQDKKYSDVQYVHQLARTALFENKVNWKDGSWQKMLELLCRRYGCDKEMKDGTNNFNF